MGLDLQAVAKTEQRKMRIFFTGGSGKAGKHAVAWLLDAGHRVLNADLVPLDDPRVDNLRVDLTDCGQVYSAIAGLAGLDDLDNPSGPPRFDAVVHFAAIPRILIAPDSEVFRVNTITTYNVIEAAIKLGIRKVIFASSETTYGVCFAQGEMLPDYLPIDEDHPTVPHDSYAMSKVANEVTARSFQARSGIDIYGLRINNVIEPHEYASMFPEFVRNPSLRRRNIFAYIDARDLGHMVECCLRTDGLGYQVFNVANADTSVGADAEDIIRRFYPEVPMRKAISGHETFYSIDKAKKLVDFDPNHGWREKIPV